ncbi:aspartate/glutamate racemase family protein [Streptomyces sp. SID13031]|uniref:maleate cis-trans isomerase family protein n=1 Tax=Streptomyces sp. SID13031 TaxID=2706046 RepID=UPI0013CBC248|nr:aspartate/glutamate racemase family protein [Streptomyces sp. SID13031]NEA30722.1 Asp/Glu racemase [Streptomyces sp. SID13031]
MANRARRIGLIVPSSNITMETEIPAMLRAREEIEPERFTFHSSRMRMKSVTSEELAAMDDESDRCAAELADAQVEVLAYACLVAIMSRGYGYHCVSQERLTQRVGENGSSAPVITSAGALVNALGTLGATSAALIAPYLKPLTEQVVGYIEHEGYRITDHIALEIPDNLEVGNRDPMALDAIVDRLDHSQADVVILSACVQMPSLAAIQVVEDRIGKPVISAALATTYEILKAMDLKPLVPRAGELLSGRY